MWSAASSACEKRGPSVQNPAKTYKTAMDKKPHAQSDAVGLAQSDAEGPGRSGARDGGAAGRWTGARVRARQGQLGEGLPPLALDQAAHAHHNFV